MQRNILDSRKGKRKMTDSTAIEVVEGEFMQLGSIKAVGPTGIIEQAASVAKCLANIVNKRHLYTDISGKKFVRVEGWTTLGAMLGILPREVSVKKIASDDDHSEGYEAYVELIRVNDGRVIGGASAICTRDERNWKKRDDYAVRSMAITRATGKAFRLGFSWIMTLAGYEPTPAEEMPQPQQHQPSRPAQHPVQSTQSTKSNGKSWPAPHVQAVLLAELADNAYNAVAMLNRSNLTPKDEVDVCIAWARKYREARDAGGSVEDAAAVANAWWDSEMKAANA